MKPNQNVDDIKKLFNSQLKNKDQYHALILFQVNPSGFTCKSNIFVLNSNVLICKIMNVKNKVLKLGWFNVIWLFFVIINKQLTIIVWRILILFTESALLSPGSGAEYETFLCGSTA